MSEFECRNGHLMAPSKGWRCQTCGEPVARMDGMSGKQILEMERCFADREEWEPVEAEPGQEEPCHP